MAYPIIGLHHVTATADEAQADLDFCVDALGLRLVKKTVNFDNHHVYHFYYGTERGAPGRSGRHSRITVTVSASARRARGRSPATSFSVPSGTLDFWRARLTRQRRCRRGDEPRFGESSIVATDPSGLAIELVATTATRGRHGRRDIVWVRPMRGSPQRDDDGPVRRRRWTSCRPARLHGRGSNEGPDPGNGQRRRARSHHRHRRTADAAPAVNGLGTVHHVAMAIAGGGSAGRSEEELIARAFRSRRCWTGSTSDRSTSANPEACCSRWPRAPGFTVDETLQGSGRI